MGASDRPRPAQGGHDATGRGIAFTHDTSRGPAMTDDTAGVDKPEDRGAPSAEYDVRVSEHDGVTRIDIADDAVARPGPGPGQPEADED